MRKQFVTYEIALKLFKLDFNEKCLATYSYNTQLYDKGRFELKTTPEPFYFPEVNLLPRFILAPLWQQAIDWAREKYNIHITPALVGNGYGFYIHIDYKTTNEGENYGMYHSFEESRKQAILKAIELIKSLKENS